MSTEPREINQNFIEHGEDSEKTFIINRSNVKTLACILGSSVIFGAVAGSCIMIILKWKLQPDLNLECQRDNVFTERTFSMLEIDLPTLKDVGEDVNWTMNETTDGIVSVNEKNVIVKDKGLYLVMMDIDVDTVVKQEKTNGAIPIFACIISSNTSGVKTRTCSRNRVMESMTVSVSSFLKAEAGDMIRTTVYNKGYIYPNQNMNRLVILKLYGQRDSGGG